MNDDLVDTIQRFSYTSRWCMSLNGLVRRVDSSVSRLEKRIGNTVSRAAERWRTRRDPYMLSRLEVIPENARSPACLLGLKAEYLRSVDEFEAGIKLICDYYLRPLDEDRFCLRDQLRFLEAHGVLDATLRGIWVDCDRVRERLLLGGTDDQPGCEEIEKSLGQIRVLLATLSRQITGQVRMLQTLLSEMSSQS